MRKPSDHTRGRGRRLGSSTSRERILDAATVQFGDRGYQATTVRLVGEAAGVDPKLVYYYFGTKEELFVAAISRTFRDQGLPQIFSDTPTTGAGADGVSASAGTQYLRAVLVALEDPALGPAFMGLVRNLGTHEESRRIFVRFVTGELIDRLVPVLPADRARERVTLAGSQLLGLVMARYVVRVPPLAALSVDEVARAVGPTIDRYLFGDVDWGTTLAPVTHREL